MILSPGLELLQSLTDILNYPTTEEWVRLKSTLISIYNRRYLCSYCTSDKYPNQPDRLEKEKKVLGCTTAYSTPVHIFDSIKYSRCPGNFYSEVAASWVEFHIHFDKGIMPHEGGYFDQSAKAIEVLRIIGNYKTERDLQRAREQENKKEVRLTRGNKRS